MEITGKKSNYAKKKIAMKNGSYNGNSPFYENIPEYKVDMAVANYPNIREMKAKYRFNVRRAFIPPEENQ